MARSLPPFPGGAPGRRSRRVAILVLVAAMAGCSGEPEDEPPPPPTLANPALPGAAAPGPGPTPAPTVYDREFLFFAAAGDSTVTVPWAFRTLVFADSTHRELSAWLGRSGSWEALAHETRTTQAMRAPWRLLPGTRIRLTAGDADRIDAVRLADPSRPLETRIGGFVTEWARPGGDPVRLLEGTTFFPSVEVSGFVLEVNRRWESDDAAPGDWIFLQAGLQLQLFLEESDPVATPRSPATFRGWSRLAFQSQTWTDLAVAWDGMRPFEPARRDIPGAWILSGAGGQITGRLEATGSHLTAGEGEGPIRPLSGFIEVRGEVTVRGEPFAVSGVVRHRQ